MTTHVFAFNAELKEPLKVILSSRVPSELQTLDIKHPEIVFKFVKLLSTFFLRKVLEFAV